MHPVLVLRAIANIEGKYSILPMPLNLRTRADVFVANFLLSCFFTDYTTIENYWFLTKGTNSCSEEFMIFKTDIVDSITIGNVLANPSHSNPRKAEKSSKGP